MYVNVFLNKFKRSLDAMERAIHFFFFFSMALGDFKFSPNLNVAERIFLKVSVFPEHWNILDT